MTGRPWDASYQDGPASWEIGPQPVVVRLAAEGRFIGPVLDVGCGSGDNALVVAALGVPVLGVDVAATAVDAAKAKAGQRGLEAEFVLADAYKLSELGRTFVTVLDSGMFHTCDDEERPRYVASLASVTEPGATLYLLCFSDEGPDVGPHPVSRNDLRTAFTGATGWTTVSVEPERVHTRFHDENGAAAWLATITRI